MAGCMVIRCAIFILFSAFSELITVDCCMCAVQPDDRGSISVAGTKVSELLLAVNDDCGFIPGQVYYKVHDRQTGTHNGEFLAGDNIFLVQKL